MDVKQAFQAVEANRDFLIATLRKMVAVDTTNPPGFNYDKLACITEPILKSFGFKTRRVVVPFERLSAIKLPLKGDRVNLVASRESGKPPVSIYAHMDVVPVEGDWKHEPFGGEIQDGKIYGRGTLDMKGEAAAMLTALKAMHDLNLTPVFDLQVLFCTDEEVGTYPGIYYLAQEGYVKGHLMWLETGSPEPLQASSFAGCLDTEIFVTGKAAHSGRNWSGVNALEESIPILEELYALKQRAQGRKLSDKFRSAASGLVSLTPLFNIDIIRSGIKSNIVPDSCYIVTNRRYLPEENYGDVVREIEEAILRGKRRSRALDVRFEHRLLYKPVVIDTNSEYAQRALRVRCMVHDWKESDVMVIGSTGSVDMGFALDAPGVRGVASFGARRTANTTGHGVDEYCDIKDLIDMAKECLLYLTLLE